MNIEPVSGALGAEVQGVNPADALSGNLAARLHGALLEHKVLFFRGDVMTPEQHLRFARIFGEPDVYPFLEGLAEAPEVIEIVKTETDTVNFGGSWHSDTAYLPCPALGTVLQAIETPDVGGDTLFANTALAYDALSDGMKALIGGLRGVNNSEGRYPGGRAAAMSRLDGMKTASISEAEVHENVHPVVRTHPETGDRSLYVNAIHTRRFENMTVEESRPLIDFLARHVQRPEFTCRLRWQPGTVAVWDNRTTQHHALNDYQGKRRRMRRVTLKGDRPH